jgi:hypothetical protein
MRKPYPKPPRRPPIEGRVMSRPIYRIDRFDGEQVEMAQGANGLWWFRYTTVESLPVRKAQVRKHEEVHYDIRDVRVWSAWYLPKLQMANPDFMPGESARRIKGKYALLPVNENQDTTDGYGHQI